MPMTQTGAIPGNIVSNTLTFLAAILETQKMY